MAPMALNWMVKTSDDSGFSVSAAGDINGDGYADLIIGARLSQQYGSQLRGVWWSGGGRYGTIRCPGLNGANGFKLDGENNE